MKDIVDYRTRLETPVPSGDVYKYLKSFLPGLFDDGAPKTIREAVLHQDAVHFPTYGTLYDPKVALRVETERHDFDQIYLALYKDFGNHWMCGVGAHINGGYNFRIQWSGMNGQNHSTETSIHWNGYTPKIVIDSSTRQLVIINYGLSTVSQKIALEDAMDNDRFRMIQKDGRVYVDHIAVDSDRNTIGFDLTNKQSLAQVFHFDVPLSLCVNYDEELAPIGVI